MTGIYITRLKTGVTKLIHLRNVTAVILENTSLTFYYNFPCVPGKTYYERLESKPAYDIFIWPTETDAVREFEICKKAMAQM